MSMQINKSAYEKLIKEDIEWLLSNTKDSLERRHIVEVLNYSSERLYPNSSSEIPNDLEEAARRYQEGVTVDTTINYCGASEDVYFANRIVESFKSGAEWHKSQMLKDAVEGRVFMSFAPGHNQMVMADVDLPTNTKVRLIVLKEEEEQNGTQENQE